MSRFLHAVVVAVVLALLTAGCAAPIPIEKIPDGWALNVHQPGEWWTQPLIPRSVVVQRCPPRPGWSSEPDLSRVTALPPGIDVNYSFWTDDYHCDIGWSAAPSRVQVAADQRATEAGLRTICSASGLSMDEGWRFLGHNLSGRPGDRSAEVAVAAFIDEYGTIVSCFVGYDLGEEGIGASVELSVGGGPAVAGPAACPVRARNLARSNDGTVEEYQLQGAGVVRNDAGVVLTRAASLRIGMVGDGVTTTHPVIDGVAIVDARVTPKVAIRFDDWDHPPAVEGQVFDARGDLLATCRG